MVKKTNKTEEFEDDIVNETEETPTLPLTADGARFFMNLIEYAAKNGVFNLSQYDQISQTYTVVRNFLVETGALANKEEENE